MNVIDWILNLFRDEVSAQAFVDDPERAMCGAGVQNVSAAQLQHAAAAVAPAAVVHGGGDPVVGLQQAVAQTHGIAFTPQRQTEAFSNNDTLSHNDTRFLSPETNTVNHAG
ncbi:IniB N-terminal domain-containing protein, partial [Mycolicibacterium novocastrense]